jgi:hypothetical protein
MRDPWENLIRVLNVVLLLVFLAYLVALVVH